MNLKKQFLGSIAIALSVFLVGCSDKDKVSEFNKPALYWYQQIADSISDGNLDKADGYFISLKSEHMRSPLMPTAMMMLVHAHMNEEEYLLANYYLDEYNKRYGEYESREYADFMKLQASFLGVKDVYKDQKLVMDTIQKANIYLNRYPGSSYTPLVNTLLIRLQMTEYLLNENIAALYDRTGKDKAAQICRDKNKCSVVEKADITPPEQSFIGKIFN